MAEAQANTGGPDQGQADERIKEAPLVTRLMRRPELGAIAGLILVSIFFMFTADSRMFSLAGIMNFMEPASQQGILAIGASLLMVGGEFDLSVGSMVAFAGLVFGAALVVWGLPLSLAIVVTLVFAGLCVVAIGLDKAFTWYQKATGGGGGYAQSRLALAYQNGAYGLKIGIEMGDFEICHEIHVS